MPFFWKFPNKSIANIAINSPLPNSGSVPVGKIGSLVTNINGVPRMGLSHKGNLTATSGPIKYKSMATTMNTPLK